MTTHGSSPHSRTRNGSRTRCATSSGTSCASGRSASAARSRWSATCSATSSSSGAGSRSRTTARGWRSRSSRPGPLAAQLAIYLGWLRGGVARRDAGGDRLRPALVRDGARAVVRSTSRYGGLAWMQGAFYGIGAAVIAIIARSAYKLTRATLGSDRLLWAIFVVSALVTAWTESEIVWLFLALPAWSRSSRSTARRAEPRRRRSLPWPLARHRPARPGAGRRRSGRSPGTSPRRARSCSAAASRSCRSCTAAS